MNSPGRDNGDSSFGSFGEPADDGLQVVVCPDDISELDSEVRAYRREVARARTRARWRSAAGAPGRAVARCGRWLGRMLRYALPW
ncbi:hypothetical protein GCM10009839_04920 [Catenulispora yoronensis]|uniref:Uncharacterized protein n=1 Tax=Catenulispora yoronensis TaxID=450799 RepID=A0ABN2TLB3_9ACTN